VPPAHPANNAKLAIPKTTKSLVNVVLLSIITSQFHALRLKVCEHRKKSEPADRYWQVLFQLSSPPYPYVRRFLRPKGHWGGRSHLLFGVGLPRGSRKREKCSILRAIAARRMRRGDSRWASMLRGDFRETPRNRRALNAYSMWCKCLPTMGWVSPVGKVHICSRESRMPEKRRTIRSVVL